MNICRGCVDDEWFKVTSTAPTGIEKMMVRRLDTGCDSGPHRALGVRAKRDVFELAAFEVYELGKQTRCILLIVFYGGEACIRDTRVPLLVSNS